MLPNDFKNYNQNTEKCLIVLLNFNINNYYIKIDNSDKFAKVYIHDTTYGIFTWFSIWVCFTSL